MREFKTQYGRYVLGDARELIKEVPTASVDVIITDPPYGFGIDEYDVSDVFFDIEDEMWRVLKPDAWLVFYYATKRLPEAFKLRRFRYVWAIACVFLGMKNPKRTIFGDQMWNLVLVFAKGKPKVSQRYSDIIYGYTLPLIPFKVKDPQFKPTMANAMLVGMFSKPKDLVLDPFAGFGSIPIVCELLGRRWLAFEIDPLKFEVAYKFIVEHKPVNTKKVKGELKVRESVFSLESFISGGEDGIR